MDIKRAREIINSTGMTNVKYNEKSVWLENIIEATNEVEVKDLETGERHLVDVSKLV
ncbi:H-type small acid-soluble spore protein [Inconstantimicrobium mannanitabidum]|uniref:Uncharacterized protein n=1 Tax=Inconstantimicrobium mannanitabidum TaxID=1604901 RepID=A0ACB5R9I2_9CLOT|nr:H-type small acid-soluble spore protein [Clostridium sp. TW13]GKX65706.1 hypothetical protein rsdtw13_09640 [Clostridium sp. TW13]